MGLRINQNVAAMNSYRNLSVSDGQMSKSLEKLSSGFRINRAADDAAGLAISEGLRSQVGGLKVAVRNAQDGVNVAQTAEGALNETTSILQRMRDLSVQAQNAGTYGATAADGTQSDSVKAIQSEADQLAKELTRIAGKTEFNGQKLLNGSYAGAFQIGANAGDTLTVKIDSGTASKGFDATTLAVGSGTDEATTKALDVSASTTLTAIDTALKNTSSARANLGAVQNRFEHTITNLNVAVENLSASESAIRDTDMAQEMTKFTRSQILQQAGTSMLAQANQSQQSVLKLLG
jgi:flagellin